MNMRRRHPPASPQRSVRVYTVNDESRYVIARNIPAVGVADEALKRLSRFGEIEDHHVLPQSMDEQAAFTESLWVKYETVTNARHAKAKAKNKPMVGNVLEVAYAPQDETPEDTARKLLERREMIERRAMPRSHATREDEASQRRPREEFHVEAMEEFIGPQLPPRAVASTAAVQLVPRAVDRSKRRRI